MTDTGGNSTDTTKKNGDTNLNPDAYAGPKQQQPDVKPSPDPPPEQPVPDPTG